MRFVNLCNPENRRRNFFDEALSRAGHPPASIISYQQLLQGGQTHLDKDSVLRIESPGENFDVWKRMVERGLDLDGMPHPPIQEDFGRVQYQRPWFGGFVSVLNQLQTMIDRAGCRVINRPSSIRLMFDKYACQKTLVQAGIAVPSLLPPVGSYDELREVMLQSGASRIFIKPLYSSSASGVIAYRISGPNEEATSSIDVIEEQGEFRYYNSLKINRYKRHHDIRRVIDFILGEGAYAEEWIPKATLDREVFDVRIVVIDGKPAFVLPRLSQGPITNLHLGNRRGDAGDLFRLLGEKSFNAMCSIACDAVEAVGAFYAGVDVLIPMGLGQPRVLEVNAFGDLLPGLLDERGNDTYSQELHRFLHKHAIHA